MNEPESVIVWLLTDSAFVRCLWFLWWSINYLLNYNKDCVEIIAATGFCGDIEFSEIIKKRVFEIYS